MFAPGGIGVREAAMVFLLAPLMSVEHAIALSVFSRLWLIATDLTSGLAAYTMVRLAPRGR